MNPPKSPIEDLTGFLSGLLPDSVDKVRQDIEQNLRSGLEGQLKKMDLVTREEFDIQSAVLSRTRDKLEKLEKIVAQLEAEILNQSESESDTRT